MVTMFFMSLIVLVTVLGRILSSPVPVPITAMVFATGSFVERRWSAAAACFGALLISDSYLGLHPLMPAVYGSLIPVLFLAFRWKRTRTFKTLVPFTVLASLVYFGLSNFGVWFLGGCGIGDSAGRPLTLAELVDTYAAAIHLLPGRILADTISSIVLVSAGQWVSRGLRRTMNSWGFDCEYPKATERAADV